MKARQRTWRAWARAGVAALVLLLAAPPLMAAQASTSANGRVNVNTANVDELQLLPGVGEARAEAILATRKSLGGFTSVEQLVEVKGIGETLLERLRPHVTLKGKTTARRP